MVRSFTHLAVRPFLMGPSWLRSMACGAAAVAVIGMLVIVPEGVDFTELSTVALAVGLSVAIPALFGLCCPPAVEWTLRPQGWARTASLKLVAAPLAIFLFPPALTFLGIPIAIVLAARWGVQNSSLLSAGTRHPAMLWMGRAGWETKAASRRTAPDPLVRVHTISRSRVD